MKELKNNMRKEGFNLKGFKYNDILQREATFTFGNKNQETINIIAAVKEKDKDNYPINIEVKEIKVLKKVVDKR